MALIVPTELKDFHRTFEKLSYMYDKMDVFDTFLEWIMWGFCADNSMNWDSGKKYKPEQQAMFLDLFKEWVKVIDKQVNADGKWYDLFGTYYEAYVASKSRRDCKGQFFTPPHVCDLMAQIVDGQVGESFNDPCIGSGRFGLAYHTHNIGNYLYCSDLDRTCCMMSVCNFIVHGCMAEVVWQDSLNPDSWLGGWRVNWNLNNPFHKYYGVPHVETIQRDDSRAWHLWQAKKAAVEVAPPPIPVIEAPPLKQKNELQLTLF